MRFRRLDYANVPWSLLDTFWDRTVFQTREWLEFLAETQGGTPVIAELRDGDCCVGYFTGMTFSKCGVKILGSSFRGWTTSYMGFNLYPEIPRGEPLAALERFAFGDLKCLHLEVLDRHLSAEDGCRLGFSAHPIETYESDLRGSEDGILEGMTSACRRCLKKSVKCGVTIEEAHDEDFATEYFEQLVEVFARQGLSPPYGVSRVQALMRRLLPTGRLLLLRARAPDGQCIATGIFPAANRTAHFWGNASHTESRHLRPNEAIHWYAMRYWSKRGLTFYDWGGGGDYKAKYGGRPIQVPWFRKSRFRIIAAMRTRAERFYRRRQQIGALFGPRASSAKPVPSGCTDVEAS